MTYSAKVNTDSDRRSEKQSAVGVMSEEKLGRLQERVRLRKYIVGCGEGYTAAITDSGRVLFAGDNRWGQAAAETWTDVVSIAVSKEFMLGLLRDGTVCAAGRNTCDQLNVKGWSCVQAVACGYAHSAAVIQNGRVVCTGDNSKGQCDTSSWNDVTDLSCGKDFTAGITSSGSVLVAGGSIAFRHAVSKWSNIIGIFSDCDGQHLYAIDSSGMIISDGHIPSTVKKWRNTVHLSVAGNSFYAITASGSVNVYNDPSIQKKLLKNQESEYIASSHSGDHVIFLDDNGRVKVYGDNRYGQCDIPIKTTIFDEFGAFCTMIRANEQRRKARELEYKKRECEAERFSRRLACSERITAAISASGRIYATGNFRDIKKWSDVCALSCGNAHILGLKTDGRVVATGNDVDGCTSVEDWKNINCIFAGKYHSVACTDGGRVLFAGRNDSGQGNVTEWTGVRRIFGTDTYTVGLKADGRLVATGDGLPCDVKTFESDRWTDIVSVCATDSHVAALKSDGTVLTAGNSEYEIRFHDCTATWHGVKSIAAGDGYTVGLCYGGRVVSAGENAMGQCNTENWSSVVSISAGRSHTVGLKLDGTVFSTGAVKLSAEQAAEYYDSPNVIDENQNYVRYDTSAFHDIVAIACGSEHTVAIDRGGQVLASGLDSDGQCLVAFFTMFKTLDQYDFGYSKNTESAVDEKEASSSTVNDTAHNNTQIRVKRATQENKNANLIADSEYYINRISGGDDHISFINSDGNVQSYSFVTGEIITEPSTGVKVEKIVSGKAHMLTLYENGAVLMREDFSRDPKSAVLLPTYYNAYGQLKAVDVAAGKNHSVILLSDGTVRAVGNNKFGQCDVTSFTRVKAVSAAGNHTVALTEDGRVLAVGAKGRDVSVKVRSVAHAPRWNPCLTEKWRGVQKIECADDITLGLQKDGGVLAVGNNNFGQCKTGFWYDAISVKSSGRHTAALFADGHVEATGSNESGECETSKWENIIMIALRAGATFGLRSDGRVLVAGRCECSLDTEKAVRAIFCFEKRLVLMTADGALYTQRHGTRLPLERLDNISVMLPTVENNILTRAYGRGAQTELLARAAKGRIAIGLSHNAVIDERGELSVAGSNFCGQCDIMQKDNVAAVSSGSYHTCALLSDGSVRVTGRKCGDKDAQICESELNSYASGMKYVSVACGTEHTVAVLADGRVYGTGSNNYGQCELSRIRNAVDVSCGVRHTAILTDSGRVTVVGDNSSGQADTSEWTDIVMTACGEFHTVGLKRDGRVVAVGDNRAGQCELDDLENIVAVACLPKTTLCLCADGTVIARGSGAIPTDFISSLREVIAISACEYRISALCSDGRLLISNN